MKKIRSYILSLTMLMGSLATMAQDIVVNVAPVQRVLPPQVLLFVADPGKYFTIQLMNTSAVPQQVHLGLQIEQVMPQGDLAITTPAKRQPLQPFVVPANGQITLTPTEMKHLFDHIPASEISAPASLFESYTNGGFGLLPEGQYQIHVTAYQWSHPQPTHPIVVSSPTGGSCLFTVCYTAQSPTFMMPMTLGTKEMDVAEVDPFNALFTWVAPVLTCDARSTRYEYKFRVAEIPQGWSLDQALDHGPVVYQRDGLMVPQCIIPQNIITSQFYTNKRYVAQVTATSASSNPLDYTLIANEGKSDPRMFRIKTSDENLPKPPMVDETPKEEPKPEAEDTIGAWMRDVSHTDSLDNDSLYTFRNPRLTEPFFLSEEGARKKFEEASIAVKWDPVFFMGGEGLQADTLNFEYEVQLYAEGDDDNPDREEVLKGKPILTHRTKELEDSIQWDEIKEKVKVPDYLVLRVKPIVVKGASVAFANDSINTIDFAMAKRLSKTYFQCSNTVIITNEKPTEKKAADYKGKTVQIGEYELTIDEISGSGMAGFTGTGRVKWEPLGTTVMVCVKFNKMKINTDDVVYEGVCETYASANVSSMAAVDKLFSDWGIDNLIGDSGIPYAEYLQSSATDAVKDIAKKVNLSSYYKYIKTGNELKDLVTKGKIDELYMPVALPKSINKTPVDIQICKMKFAPGYATMDVIGEFTLPNSSYTKNDILVFGAPRLCISPNRVLPEAGTIALLSDFGIKDPKSSYEMTFKAPKNVVKPEDGCYIAWKADALELLGIDVDMKIPGLVKDVNGKATKEKPTFNVRASIADWDDWMVDNVSIDPFQVENLPGWTFTAENIVYDHSLYRNSNSMGKFPSGYDVTKADLTEANINPWQGLYISKVAIAFPTALKIGTKGKERLELSANDMFFDKSGATLTLSATNLVQTGTVGGWSFDLSSASLSFVQDNFNNCQFKGKFSVPLLSGKIGYTCNILKQTSNTKNAEQYAYVFKAQQIDDMSLDFLLATAEFNEDQTYFLVEALPAKTSGFDTKVELVMGGDITLGGTDYLNKKIKNSSLPMKFEIPGVHFCGLRLANCSNTWESTYESKLQNDAKNAKLDGISLYKGKEIVLASNKIYFHTGKWSLASDKKTLGPFDFNLTKYDFSYEADPKDGKKKLKTTLKGEISLISGISLSAGAGLSIYSNVNLPKDLTNIGGISLDYDRTQFDEASFSTKFADMEISGSLTVANDKDKEGYSGDLTFKMPGNLFYITANGGYYKNKSGGKFTYGWFYAEAGGKAGIPIDPLKIHRLQAGFYYNCSKDGKKATPKEGVIGVVAGLGLSTSAGESLVSGDFDMTVVYDRSNTRLSTLMMTGDLKAVEGLVSVKTNVVYQNDDKNQYLRIDATVDAKADSEKVLDKIGGKIVDVDELKKTLNSSYSGLVKGVAEDGFEGKIDETKSDKLPARKAPKKGEEVSVSVGSKVSVQFMVTMKKDGKRLNQAKWHVYVGEPDFNKRCYYQYLKLKTKVLSVDIGANGYLCIGNELPDGGKLPDIPPKIRQFLNGSNDVGIQSADVSKANTARKNALDEFNRQCASNNGGGVMLGAQVWGYFDVDLGIFYLYSGATAGFDMSLVKLGATVDCTNISGQPGWKGWYANGQLYAYLYAKFGIKFNLGFWKHDFDVADAGIGGVFRLQGPKPSHFDGEARVKLKLLGGLVNVDRKYNFSVGEGCDMFAGNALDEFKIFDKFSIGYETEAQGWDDKNKLDPKLSSRPCLYTTAPLKEPFRIVDPTELARLKKNYSGDPANLEAEAARTFIFRSDAEAKVVLWEYKNKNRDYPVSRTYNVTGQSRYANYIGLTELKPDRYYLMTVTVNAKEIQKGSEVNPVTYDEKAKKYVNKAWSQTMTYYFCTGKEQPVQDNADLQKYIAIAYPSHYNRIKYDATDQFVNVHDHDMKRPNFALTKDISKAAFQQGALKWRIYDSEDKIVCERDNEWIVTDKTCNMRPVSDLTGYKLDTKYKLRLEYLQSTRNRKFGLVNTHRTVVAEMKVCPRNSDWKKGYKSGPAKYEAPFVGCRINSVEMRDKTPQDYDYTMATTPSKLLMNPYMYISALSNYIFIGGWELTADRLDINVTTAQSVIYTDKGGVYEGHLGTYARSQNIVSDYAKIMKMSIYDMSQYENITRYPLPVMEDEIYSYALPGLPRATAYKPSDTNWKCVSEAINDMYSVYPLCEAFSSTIKKYCLKMDRDVDQADPKMDFTARANKLQEWYNARRGQYITSYNDAASLSVPAYQFPIIYGSCFENKGAMKKVTAWGTIKDYAKQFNKNSTPEARGHENNSEIVFSMMLGRSNITGGYCNRKKDGASTLRSRAIFENTKVMKKAIKRAHFLVYRVNAYDFKNCCYIVHPSESGQQHTASQDVISIENPLTYGGIHIK